MTDFETEFAREDVDTLLDRFERAVDGHVCAQIDAAGCGTRRDWENARLQEDACGIEREYVLQSLVAKILRKPVPSREQVESAWLAECGE